MRDESNDSRADAQKSLAKEAVGKANGYLDLQVEGATEENDAETERAIKDPDAESKAEATAD